jgi:hypothetical protein
MNKELIQKLFSKSCWDEQAEVDIEDFISVEKFAELIVRECIQVCADRGAHHDGLYSAWADDCSKRIGKHFGVEE